MRSDSGSTKSVWMEAPAIPALPELSEDIRAEVCVVGAGIAGLSTAYHLVRDGRRVVVLDDGPVAGGETARTTAHLTNIVDDRYHWIEQIHGERGLRIVAESHTAAIDRIEAIVRKEQIDCDFERLDGFLFGEPGDSPDELERELEAARRAGLGGVAWADRAPFAQFETGRCLRFPEQAMFHPLRYLAGLARAIERGGGRIHVGSHAAKIEDAKDGHPPRVTTEGGRVVTANAIVVATNSPVHELIGVHPKQAAYRTYVIAARVPRGSTATALFYDTASPYHYVRLYRASQAAEDLLIVGGEDHKTGQADDAVERWQRLEAWARERFPEMEGTAYRWSGQVFEPADGVAFIGRDHRHSNVYLATGDSGMGMTHGTIAGMLLSDLIAGRPNPWEPLYHPGRTSLRAIGGLAKENVNALAQYVDYVTGGDVGSAAQVARGEGAVLRRGLKKIAVYRDEGGMLHARSAVCTHLGCIVAWNSVEKTWDCPCHGSRFDPHGAVVTGPAIAPLGPEETPKS
jgi:glycine/D-amino acid oxidase-like deaminating enzyme/nitrite reductase/ring-hydroxylating ferredoxin subunit